MAKYKKTKTGKRQKKSNNTSTSKDTAATETESNNENESIKPVKTNKRKPRVTKKKDQKLKLRVNNKIENINEINEIDSGEENEKTENKLMKNNVKTKLKIKLKNHKNSAGKKIVKPTKTLKNQSKKNGKNKKPFLDVNVEESNDNQIKLQQGVDSDSSINSHSTHKNQKIVKAEVHRCATDKNKTPPQKTKFNRSSDSLDTNKGKTDNEKNKKNIKASVIKSEIRSSIESQSNSNCEENVSDCENIDNDNSINKLKNRKRNSESSPKINKRSKIQNEQIANKNVIVRNVSPINQYNINESDDISCRSCEQKLNNDLKFFSGEPQHGCEENMAIIDSRLLLFDGNEKQVSQEDTRAYNKITSFSVYCKNGHLCQFDSGLIERDINIFFAGYVKPIYSDDPSTENGVAGKDFGPIALWWITGFDVGEQPTVALSTELGDYILMEPSEEYKPFMKSVIVKILISKIVIEYLIYEPNETYEGLVAKLQNTPLPNDSLSSITEDTLLYHALFLCDQVMSFDDTAKPNEPLLITASCMRRIIDLYGIAFEQPRKATLQKYMNCRKVRDYREELLRRDKQNEPVASDLINRLLPVNILSSSREPQLRNRCEACDRCRRPSCENCHACNRKRYDECAQRRCFYREIQEANDEDARDNLDSSQLKVDNSINVYKSMIKTFSCNVSKIKWLGLPDELTEEAGNTYYPGIELDGFVIKYGDYVYVRSVDPEVPTQVVRVAYLWRDDRGIAYFHGNYLWWGRDTALGELADKKELFSINKCFNMPMTCIQKKVRVMEYLVPKNWDESVSSDFNRSFTSNNDFYCQKSYNPESGRFEDLKIINEAARSKSNIPSHRYCQNCERIEKEKERKTMQAFDILEQNNDDKTTVYGGVKFMDEEYHAGSCVYLKPKSLYFKYPMLMNQVKSSNPLNRSVDETKYSEYYRKSEDPIKNFKSDIPAAYDIGYITKIFSITDKLYIKVKKFYRPENTHRGEMFNKSDVNMLFWSEEECTVAFSYVIGKCYVVHAKNLNSSVEEWSALGPDRFYFTQIYKNNQFSDVDKREFSKQNEIWDIPKMHPKVTKLKTLDIFAGCGGLSLGLREAGLTKNCWAIEVDKSAASTYKLNSPDTVVIVEDCEIILKKIMEGETNLDGQPFPLRTEVDLLCATLPWQNFRTTDAVFAFKISHLATFLSYVDYYRPAFFVLETDERLAKRNSIFKIFLTCIVGLGYQIAFDLMQVGCYGVPQNRKRCVLLGAAPGEILPKYPKHLHVFAKQFCHSNIIIDNKKYTQENDGIDSAPYRAITIRDALSDLPAIGVAIKEEILNYHQISSNYFQKSMRRNMLEPTLFDHICKDLGPLVEARIMQIPTAEGSDWRNLPNIEVQMRDGNFTNKLVYNHDDLKAGRSAHGALRGVCGCAAGKQPCDPRDRQTNTLIPWHLVHSGRRHAHWPGLYGRLSWDGFIAGNLTNPEPLGKQGPVIHPSQPRVLSVRECARCQGFPDDFTFGPELSVNDKYRLIGQSASPLLGLALGRKIAHSYITTRKSSNFFLV